MILIKIIKFQKKRIIDYKVKSLSELFYNYGCIKRINFINFNIFELTDMSGMFYDCDNLEQINFYKFITNNVSDMEEMFFRCGH